MERLWSWRALKTLIVVGCFCGMSTAPVWAVFDMGRQSLEGMDGVQVIVRKIAPDIEKAGLAKEDIQHRVEEKLKDADIKVLDARETLFSPGAPSLDIDVKTFPLKCKDEESKDYFFLIDVSLTQGIFLARDSKINLHADTWTARDYGQTATLEEVKTKTDHLIDRFIDAYKAAQTQATPTTLSPQTKETNTDLGPLEEK